MTEWEKTTRNQPACSFVSGVSYFQTNPVKVHLAEEAEYQLNQTLFLANGEKHDLLSELL